MASLNQLVSEIVHSLSQPNNYALRTNVKSVIIHTRNELIRRSFENHKYLDKSLQYRYAVSLTDVNDGDIQISEELDIPINKIKRTLQKVPRPVRLTNNLPFHRISTVGFKHNIVIPFIKETSARFASSVPGLCGLPSWDYINDYLYLFPVGNSNIDNINKIVIEAAFEHPTEVARLNNDSNEYAFLDDDDEWFLPEDMIGQIKDIVYKRELLANYRENNEIPKQELMN